MNESLTHSTNPFPHRSILLVLAFSFLIGLFGTGLTQPSPALASTTESPAIGQPVVLSSTLEDRSFRITVNQVIEDPAAIKSSRRGFQMLAAEISIENLSDEAIDLTSANIALLDDAGTTIWDTSWKLSGQASRAYPRFDTMVIVKGKSASGWFVYEIATEAKPSSIVYFAYDSPPFFAVLAWIDPVEPNADGHLPIIDPTGNLIGTLKVDSIITNFERTDSGIEPRRGWSTIGVAVTMTNQSDETWNFRDEDFWIVDDFGEYYSRSFYDRSMDSYKAFPDLGFRARAEQSASGVLMFEIPEYTSLNRILYVPSDDQFFVVGGADPDITLSGHIALETIDIDSRTSLDPACEGIDAWAEETIVSLETAAQQLEDASDPDADIDAADLRKGAEQMRLLANHQRELDVPAAAQDAQDAVIHVIEVTSEELDAAAGRAEAGEDMSSVLDLLNSPQSPITAAGNDAVLHFIDLTKECDFSAF